MIANTYHELSASDAILNALYASMRQNARLVVVDRTPRSDMRSDATSGQHHAITRAAVEKQTRRHGFETVAQDDRFIDRAGEEDLWWLLVLRKP